MVGLMRLCDVNSTWEAEKVSAELDRCLFLAAAQVCTTVAGVLGDTERATSPLFHVMFHGWSAPEGKSLNARNNFYDGAEPVEGAIDKPAGFGFQR